MCVCVIEMCRSINVISLSALSPLQFSVVSPLSASVNNRVSFAWFLIYYCTVIYVIYYSIVSWFLIGYPIDRRVYFNLKKDKEVSRLGV